MNFELRITYSTGKTEIINGKFLDQNFSIAEGTLKSVGKSKSLNKEKKVYISEIKL